MKLFVKSLLEKIFGKLIISEKNWLNYSRDSQELQCIYSKTFSVSLPHIARTLYFRQQECFYDNDGDLVDEKHEDAACRGTANQYNGHGLDLDALRHTFIDEGGIWEKGRDGVINSVEQHWDNFRGDEAVEAAEPNSEGFSDSDSQSYNGNVFDNW